MMIDERGAESDLLKRRNGVDVEKIWWRIRLKVGVVILIDLFGITRSDGFN